MDINFAEHIPAYDSWLKKGADIPKNTTEDSDVKAVGEGGMNSSIVVYADVSGVTLASGKKITLTVKTSDDGETWKDLHTEEVSGTPDGRVMDYVLPPSCKENIKVTYGTDDASADGTIDIYLRYIPR